jgi:hypothetical protein
MEAFFKKPDELCLDGNLEENWNRFHRQFLNFVKLINVPKSDTEKAELDGPTKVAMLLNLIGNEACELFDTFTLSEKDKTDYDKVIVAFAEYCTPKANLLFERFKFYQRNQQEGETFEHFYAEVKRLAKSCTFGIELDNMIRDRLVLGIRHLDLQEALIRSTDVTLKAVADKCRMYEINLDRSRQMQKGEVDAIRKFKSNFNRDNRQNSTPYDRKANESQANETVKAKLQCKWCGYKHNKGSCPAYGKRCSKCDRPNHFAKVCRYSKTVHELEESGNTLYVDSLVQQATVQNETGVVQNETCVVQNKTGVVQNETGVVQNEFVNTFYIDTLEQRKAECNSIEAWYQYIEVGGVPINFKLDSGSDVNTLPLSEFNKIKLSQNINFKNTAIICESYSGDSLVPKGEINLKCCFKNKELM